MIRQDHPVTAPQIALRLFSSRRRHTRFDCDWSSDVCSSDLSDAQLSAAPRDLHFPREASFPLLLAEVLPPALERILFLDADMLVLEDLANLWETPQIGRASCRERV